MTAVTMDRIRFYPPCGQAFFDSMSRRALDDAANLVSSLAVMPVLQCSGYHDHRNPAAQLICNETVTDGYVKVIHGV